MEHVVVTIDEQGIALLELNRPDILNVLNLPLVSVKMSFRIMVSVKGRSALKISLLIKRRAVLR